MFTSLVALLAVLGGYYGQQIQPTCTRIGIECSTDCSTLMTCIGSDIPRSTKQCHEGTPKKPYCVNGVCSASPNTANANCYGPFICTDIGYFPDAENCVRYHYCAGINTVSELHECDEGRIYDSEAQGCVVGVAKKCAQNKCPSKVTESVALKSNAAYYMFCNVSPFGWTQKVVLRCQLEDTHIFDATVQQCQFECKEAGEFVDRQDCHRFHSCTKRGSKFTYNNYLCPDNFYFDGERCEVETVACTPQIPVPPEFSIATGEEVIDISAFVGDANEI